MVAMVTMATNITKTMAKYAFVKSVAIWLYEYDIHSVMDGVHITEILEHPASAISTKMSAWFAFITRSNVICREITDGG